MSLNYDDNKAWQPDLDADSIACDRCGRPTPRLLPPQPTELCDACAQAEDESEDPAERDATDIHVAAAGFMVEILKAKDVNRALRLSSLLQEGINALEAIQSAANSRADQLCK